MAVKSVVVVNGEQADTQAIYVDGTLHMVASTAYAFDIIKAAGGPSVPFTLDFFNRSLIEPFQDDEPGGMDWPHSLDLAIGMTNASFVQRMSESQF